MFNTLHFLGNSNKGLKACLTHNMHSLKCEQVNMSFYERMQILSKFRSELFVDFTLVYHIIFDERRDRKCFLFVNLALKHVKRNKTSNFALKYISMTLKTHNLGSRYSKIVIVFQQKMDFAKSTSKKGSTYYFWKTTCPSFVFDFLKT